MALTQSQLVDLAARRLKVDTDNVAKTGILADLNIAQQILASLLSWKELMKTGTLSLADGTETYSLASDVQFVEQMRITSPTDLESVLTEVDKEIFRQSNPVTSNDGETTPKYWYFTEPSIGSTNLATKQVSFFPIPEQSYTVTYSYKADCPELDSNTDVPFFDGNFHHILADYACWKYAEREPDPTLNPTYWKNEWEEGKRLLMENYRGWSKYQMPIKTSADISNNRRFLTY